jgi:hypothetical protein
MGGAGGFCPPPHVAGMTTAGYGMTTSGTPIGLPGPPHLPLGHPAGLCYHAIHNHTHHQIPHPVNHFNVHVRQQPGLSYPKPVSQVHINEQVFPDPVQLPGPQPYCPPQQ